MANTPRMQELAMSTKPSNSMRHLRKSFQTASGKQGQFYSLPALAKTWPNVKRLPVSLRIVLEAVMRH